MRTAVARAVRVVFLAVPLAVVPTARASSAPVAPALADPASASTAAPDFTVVTPAVAPIDVDRHRWGSIAAPIPVGELLIIGPAVDVSTRRHDRATARDVGDRAVHDGFDPAERFGAAIVAALEARGRTARYVAIPRRIHGGSHALDRDEVPEGLPPGRLVDASVPSLQLFKSARGFGVDGRFTFRVLTTDGRLLEPTRAYTFARPPKCPKVRLYICEDPPEDCVFESGEAIESAGPRIWACFDAAFRSVAARIAADAAPDTSPATH